MNRFYYLLTLAFILGSEAGNCQSPSFGWTRTGGDTTYDQGRGIVTDKNRNVIVTGMFEQHNANFSGTILDAKGQHDVLLLKYSSDGSLIWARRAGGSDGDVGHAVAVDTSDNIFVAGEFETISDFGPYTVDTYGSGDNDGFIAKYDKNGNVMWVRQIGSTRDDKGYGIVTDEKGFAYTTGFMCGPVNTISQFSLPGYGGEDIYVSGYDPYGNCAWAKCFGGSGNDRGNSIIYNGGAYLYVSGYFSGTANFDSYTLTSNGGTDVFLAKISIFTGAVQWVKNYGGTSDEICARLHRDRDGFIYAAGSFKSAFAFGSQTLTPVWNSDIMLLKFDADGNPLWARQAGGGYSDYGRGVVTDNFGNVYLCGDYGGYCNFGNGTVLSSNGLNDLFIASYTSDGTLQWAMGAGSSTDDLARSIWVTPEGIPYVTGIFRDTVSFSGVQKVTYGKEDMWVSKIILPTAPVPTVSTTNLTVTPLNCDGLRISWTNGNGQKRMLIGHMETPVNYLPQNGVTYSASDEWGRGSNLGDKSIVLYIGTGNTLDLTGLIPGMEYYFTVVDFNGTSLMTNYALTNLPVAHGMMDAVELIAYSDDDYVCGGASTILHGIGASHFEWTSSTGAHFSGADNVVSPAVATTYHVVATRGMCIDSNDVTIDVFGTAPTVTVTSQPALCNSVCTGSANVMASGTGPFFYEWTDIGVYTQHVSNLCPGDYTVRVTDADGCFNSAMATIGGSSLSVSATKTDVACNEQCNGTAASIATGSGNISYLWSNGATTSSISGLCSGNYTVTVTNTSGCIAQDQVTVQALTAPAATIAASQAACAGICNGIAVASISNATAPFTYTWSNGSSQPSLNNLCAGNYSVVITDANGCHATSSASIINAPSISLNISTSSHASCTAICDGGALSSVSNGTAPYSYQWSNGETTINATHLCSGSNYLSIIDANGCSVNQYFSTPVADEMVAGTIVNTNVSCAGMCNGSAEATVINGIAPFTYNWSNGSNQVSANQLCTGNYNITITDHSGCTATAQLNIISNPQMVISTTGVTAASCNSVCNGKATANIINGTAPYQFLWTNGETGATATLLCEGVHQVVVTDASGCAVTSQINIVSSPSMVVTATNISAVSCSSVCNGIATANISNGTAPYQYLWTNGGTNATSTSMCEGVHQVTVTDAMGCSAVVSVTITVAPVMISTTVSVADNSSCNGNACNGSGVISVINGTAPYAYVWDNGETGATANALCIGNHQVTVTDANGCTSLANLMIHNSSTIIQTAVSNVTTTSCMSVCNASAEVMIANGAAPFHISWSNGETDGIATHLCEGPATVEVTDALGCSSISTIVISSAPAMQLNVTLTDAACSGVCNGTASVVTMNGTAPYEYLWNNGAQSSSVSNLCSGSYTTTVTDDNGCTAQQTIQINDGSDLVINVTGQSVTCNNSCSGTATVSMLNGTGPYYIMWSNGLIDPAISNLCSGNYTVSVTDGNGCVSSQSYPVTTSTVQVQMQAGNVSCAGECNGSAVATATGNAPFQYVWSMTTEPGAQVSNVCSGNYTVEVYDIYGCMTQEIFSITEPDVLSMQVNHNDATCIGCADGSATVTAAGGTGPYSYSWSNGAITSSVQGLAGGNYTVCITDANGCSHCETITVMEDPTGISVSNNESFIRIYPNPASSELYIDVKGQSVSGNIYLYQSDGKMVKCIAEHLSGVTNQVRIDLSDVASGSYMLKLQTEKEIKSVKLNVIK